MYILARVSFWSFGILLFLGIDKLIHLLYSSQGIVKYMCSIFQVTF